MGESLAAKEGPIVCKLKLPLPEDNRYLRRLSLSYPTALFEVHAHHPNGRDTAITHLKIKCQGKAEEIAGEFGNFDDVISFDVLQKDGNRAVVHLVQRIILPNMILTAAEIGLVPDYPIFIKGGVITTIVAGPEEQVEELCTALRQEFPGTTVVSVKREYIDGVRSLLTPKQLEVFRTALSAGYWERPRRVALSDLAGVMGISKSTLSDSLAVIESKLIQHAPIEETNPNLVDEFLA